jgi:hypothetical protein
MSLGDGMPGLVWWFMAPPIYLNVRLLSKLFGEGLSEPVIAVEQFFWAIRQQLPPWLDSLVASLYSINPSNMDVNVVKYMGAYSVDGMATHAMAQFTDAMTCGKLREYYRNGLFGRFRVYPTVPEPGDGLYCYSDNLGSISLPSLVLADSTVDLTRPDDVRRFYDSKTRSALDEYHVMPGTSHVDLVNGLRAPFDTFPAIGSWLRKLGSD